MDADRFDAVARALSPARSRRALLGLAAGAAGFGREAALAGRRRTCRRGRVACRGRCCRKGEACKQGTCVTVQGTCAAGASICGGTGSSFCYDATGDNQCVCHTRIGGGTRCGLYGNASACDQCASDGDCLALGFPPGSSCTEDSGGTCVCDSDARGTCVVPCGAEDPT